MPAIPSPLASLHSRFPLVLLPAPLSTTPAPSPSQLWALGPPPTGHSESLDPLCRALQAWTRFAGVESGKVRWVDWDGVEAAPGGSLPAVHTEEGDLLVGGDVDGWVRKQQAKTEAGKGKRASGAGSEFSTPGLEESAAGAAPVPDATHQAYTSLVETSLLPAVLAALYLSPSGTAPPVCPPRSKPLLSALADTLLSWNDRRDRIEEVKRLRGGKVGKGRVLDLEEVEREAAEAMEALEVKMKAKDGKGEWFGGASSPTKLDALVYALLSIVRILPPSCDTVLRPALERCPTLVDWVKRHDP
ncbi:hypothetical protein JCM10213_004566 [Rhodosporidiobolus nylandii]